MTGVVDMSLDQIIDKARAEKKNVARSTRNADQPTTGRGGQRGGRRTGQASVGLSQIKIRTQIRGRGNARREVLLERNRNARRVGQRDNTEERGRGIQQRVRRSAGRAEKSWDHDRFDRVTSAGDSAPKKGFVAVSNLNYTVSQQDLLQLFKAAGHLLRATINFDAAGRSLGTAEIVYSTIAEAEEARRRFDSKKLDGQIISVEVREKDFREKSDRATDKQSNSDGPLSGRVERSRRGQSGRGRRGRGGRRGAPRVDSAPKSSNTLDEDIDMYMRQAPMESVVITPMV